MASRRSLFNRNGLVADQSLTAVAMMAHRSEFKQQLQAADLYFCEGLAH